MGLGAMKDRLPLESFNLPIEKIREGYFSAEYFNRTKAILESGRPGVEVTMQVFQRQRAILCGVDEALAILQVGSGRFDESKQGTQYNSPPGWLPTGSDLEVTALSEGDEISPWEPVLQIKGRYSEFAHLESLFLGVLARGTRIATNTARCVDAARGKPVLFFADRFDHFRNQEGDGWAATVGGAAAVATPAHAAFRVDRAVGTIPHALIATHEGRTEAATEAFSEHFPEVDLVALVDFNNNCIEDSLKCLEAHGESLWGVRLDTSQNMVDESLRGEEIGDFDPRGVNPYLVRAVRSALNAAGGRHVKIVVSGGFNAEKIAQFEAEGAPVDSYGAGSSLLAGNIDFTADIVSPRAKKGRWQRGTARLTPVYL